MLLIRLLQIKLYLLKWAVVFLLYKIIRKSTNNILLNLLQNLGPVYIKLGQVLSTRVDLLSPKTIKYLEQLKDNAKPMANHKVFKVFNKALGKNINTEFTDIKLISTASIAQVYSACLNNKKVAIKIIKPSVKKLITLDLKIIYGLFVMLETFSKVFKHAKPTKLVKNLQHNVLYEIDLRFEAANIEEVSANVQDIQYLFNNAVNLPNVYWQYVSGNTLVMEYINGVSIANINALNSNNVNLDNLSYDLLKLFFYQVLVNGYFHGDIHSGNVLVSANGSINLIDFGIMGKIDDTTKYYLFELFTAFLNQDYKKAAQIHFTLGWVDATVYKVEDFALACRIVMQNLLNKPQKDINIGKFLQDLFNIAKMFKMKSQENVLTLQKNLIYIENIIKNLVPNTNTASLSFKILQDLQKDKAINTYKILPNVYANKVNSSISSGLNTINNFMQLQQQKVNVGKSILTYIKLLVLIAVVLAGLMFWY